MPLFSRKSKKKKKQKAVDQITDVARESLDEVDTKQRGKDMEQEFIELESRPEGLTTAEVQVRSNSQQRPFYRLQPWLVLLLLPRC